jgi:hypothetical protein
MQAEQQSPLFQCAMSRGPCVLAQCIAVNIKLSQHFRDDDIFGVTCYIVLLEKCMFLCNWTGVQKMVSQCVLQISINLQSQKKNGPINSS